MTCPLIDRVEHRAVVAVTSVTSVTASAIAAAATVTAVTGGAIQKLQTVKVGGYIDVFAVVEVAAVDQFHDVAVRGEQLASTDVIMGCGDHLGGPYRIEDGRVSPAQLPLLVAVRGCGDRPRTMGCDEAFDLLCTDARSVDGCHQDIGSGPDGLQAALQRGTHSLGPPPVAGHPDLIRPAQNGGDLLGPGTGDDRDIAASS